MGQSLAYELQLRTHSPGRNTGTAFSCYDPRKWCGHTPDQVYICGDPRDGQHLEAARECAFSILMWREIIAISSDQSNTGDTCMMPQPHNRPNPLTLAVLASLLESTGYLQLTFGPRTLSGVEGWRAFMAVCSRRQCRKALIAMAKHNRDEARSVQSTNICTAMPAE
jgi:hypothetical protein